MTTLPASNALVGVVAGWWAPTGSARSAEPAHRMARSTTTGRRGNTALCGLVLTQLRQIPDGSPARPACAECAAAAARIPRLDQPTTALRLPPPSPARIPALAGVQQDNTAAARVARRRAFREHWMRSERACSYDHAPYDPPDPQLLEATAIPHP